MDPVSQQALISLTNVLISLIPEESDANLQPVLSINPTVIRPAWLGGFVGLHDSPQGDLIARRVEATASITVKTSTEAALPTAVSNLAQAVLSVSRAELVQQGLYSLKQTGEGPVSTTGAGSHTVAQRDILFDVLFEFVKVPEESGGIIEEIPLDIDIVIDTAQPSPSSRLIVNTNFVSDLFDWFEVIDDPQATQSTPSNWSYNTAESRIEQNSNIRGGGYQPTVKKAGTYLVLKQTADRPLVRNFTFETHFQSSSVDGIGFVFRWHDVDNFYYFLMSQRHLYRMMGKKVAGEFTFFTPPVIDDTQGYETDIKHKLRITATDDVFQVYLNDVPVLHGSDSDLAGAGRVGFMCHGNNGAAFYGINLEIT